MCGQLPFLWTRKRTKARDKPQPRVMKGGRNMTHNDLHVRPMKVGVQRSSHV